MPGRPRFSGSVREREIRLSPKCLCLGAWLLICSAAYAQDAGADAVDAGDAPAPAAGAAAAAAAPAEEAPAEDLQTLVDLLNTPVVTASLGGDESAALA